MREDRKVDMRPVIDLLRKIDPKYVEDEDHGVKDLVKKHVSVLLKMKQSHKEEKRQQAKHKAQQR